MEPGFLSRIQCWRQKNSDILILEDYRPFWDVSCHDTRSCHDTIPNYLRIWHSDPRTLLETCHIYQVYCIKRPRNSSSYCNSQEKRVQNLCNICNHHASHTGNLYIPTIMIWCLWLWLGCWDVFLSSLYICFYTVKETSLSQTSRGGKHCVVVFQWFLRQPPNWTCTFMSPKSVWRFWSS